MQAYINLNAQYGFEQARTLPYSSIQQILQNMDKLGIHQTVVEYHGGPNVLEAARLLLNDLQAIPNWQARLIPSFCVDVSVQFQNNGIARLRAMLEDCNPHCIHLNPLQGQYRLRMIDTVLDKIQDLCSVIFIDYNKLPKENASDDLLYLAKRYPQLSFIIRQVMYTGYPFVLDLMLRADNIYIDNSRMHTRGALALFYKHVGPDRVVFSTDTPSNCGAAMAAITFADLPEESKDNIRFGTFLGMFRDEASRKFLQSNCKVIPNQVKNSIWTPFVTEGKAPNVEIYDAHAHLGSSGNNWYIADADFESQVNSIAQEMDRLNVKKIVSSVCGRFDLIQSNLDMENAVKGHDRFRGYLRYSPLLAEAFTQEYLDSCFARGYFIGLKTLPGYVGVDIRDERYAPMFRYAHEHHLPVLIHSWNADLGSPAKCAEAAARWPNATIIIGHTGGGDAGRAEAEALAKDPRYKNVYFEFCGSFTSTRPWEETLKHIDYRRILYGTDSCLHEMAYEMGRLLSADIDDEKLIAILGGNAKALFGF